MRVFACSRDHRGTEAAQRGREGCGVARAAARERGPAQSDRRPGPLRAGAQRNWFCGWLGKRKMGPQTGSRARHRLPPDAHLLDEALLLEPVVGDLLRLVAVDVDLGVE